MLISICVILGLDLLTVAKKKSYVTEDGWVVASRQLKVTQVALPHQADHLLCYTGELNPRLYKYYS